MNREQMLRDILATDDFRVSYDGEDAQRVTDLAAAFTEIAMETLTALGAYKNAIEDQCPESAKTLDDARCTMIERWSGLQAMVSKMALAINLDGDEAYRRLLASDGDPNMSDL